MNKMLDYFSRRMREAVTERDRLNLRIANLQLACDAIEDAIEAGKDAPAALCREYYDWRNRQPRKTA
jgi:hypothetical protein